MSKECFIIGGGTSLQNFDFSKLDGKEVIAVNKSILNYPKAKYFVTIDHSFLHKIDKSIKTLKQSDATKIFVANFVPEYMIEKNGQIIDTRWNLVYNLKLFDMIIKSKRLDGFGETFNDFRHGNNSGYCAIQLALLLGYTTINLFGFDLVTTHITHYHYGYGESKESFDKKLEQYYITLRRALLEIRINYPDINVYSWSSISRLNSILLQKDLNSL